VTDYTFGVFRCSAVGTFVSNSGMTGELFRAPTACGHLRGGLDATVGRARLCRHLRLVGGDRCDVSP